MASFLELIKLADTVPYPEEPSYTDVSKSYRFLSHDGVNLGLILPSVVTHLEPFPTVFIVDHDSLTVSLSSKLQTVESRSAALALVVEKWRKDNLFEVLKGWRDELYTIHYPSHTAYFYLERAASPLFGVVTYGAHVVGYVPATEDKPIAFWIPRRSRTKATFPGMLDNTVAGGIGHPYGPFDTVIKECWEEAGLKEEMVRENIKPAGVLSYFYNNDGGLYQPEVEFVYDLTFPPGLTPRPIDGEVDQFYLMEFDQLLQALRNREFKPNCAVVMIDFFIRHGLISSESQTDYMEIVQRCHRRFPFPLI